MVFIIIATIIMFIVLIIWSLNNIKNMKNSQKVLYITISIIITYLITYIMYQISKQEIIYSNNEIMNVTQNILVLIFTGINGCIFIPYILKFIVQIKENEITSKQIRRKTIFILILFIVTILLEKSYMTSTQQGILQIIDKLQEK